VTDQDVIDMNRRLGGDASRNAPIRDDGEAGEWQVSARSAQGAWRSRMRVPLGVTRRSAVQRRAAMGTPRRISSGARWRTSDVLPFAGSPSSRIGALSDASPPRRRFHVDHV